MENGQLIIYQTADGTTKIDVHLENETVWLNLNLMTELFQRDKSVISKHIKNIFEEGELKENSVVANFATTAADGKTYKVDYYNLDVIISVGYRVKSQRGTQFRIWATERLREYLIKGFTMNDERFKTGKSMNYFDEMLERIRDIRTSEKVFYQKVKDIYATSIDYDPKADQTFQFFKKVQNKLLWAISKQTAAEIIANRANCELPNMGLTTWNNSPAGQIRKTDVVISKNYLNEDEIKALGLLVEQYLAFAEAQAQQRKPMYMNDWIKKLNDILILNEREILEHAGRITHDLAVEIAEMQFQKYREKQQAIEKQQSLKELENDLINFNKERNKSKRNKK